MLSFFWVRDASAMCPVLESGPLRRWRGQNRAAMFDSIGFTRISGDIRSGIPKVEGARQASALKTLNARWDRLEQAVHSIKRLTFADTPLQVTTSSSSGTPPTTS